MLCAEDELGLSDDHEGLMILGDDATDRRDVWPIISGAARRYYL